MRGAALDGLASAVSADQVGLLPNLFTSKWSSVCAKTWALYLRNRLAAFFPMVRSWIVLPFNKVVMMIAPRLRTPALEDVIAPFSAPLGNFQRISTPHLGGVALIQNEIFI